MRASDLENVQSRARLLAVYLSSAEAMCVDPSNGPAMEALRSAGDLVSQARQRIREARAYLDVYDPGRAPGGFIRSRYDPTD